VSARSADDRLLRRTALRVGLQSALAVAITVVALCGVAILVVLRSQHTDQNTLLSTAIERVDDVTDPPAGVWLVIQHGTQQHVTPALPAGFPDEAALAATSADGVVRTADVTTGQGEYSVRTQRHGDDVVQAILDLRSAHLERDRLLQALLITGAVGLLLAGATGAWLARRAVTPLEHALSLQRRFVADAGHELRTPLTLLSTRAQLLQRRSGDTALKSDVDDLVADTRQLTEILEDLLLAADPREDTPKEPVDLTALVRHAVAAAEPAATERGVQLSVDTPGPVSVNGYEAGLRRAVNALLDNGIRHASTTLRVTVEATGREARIDVADDGPGIDPAIMPTMFARFASGSTDTPPGQPRRYGIGLSLVNEIAARHHGTVTAHNTDTGGALLRLTLPPLRRTP
jgi:signal transduction histidine kinase